MELKERLEDLEFKEKLNTQLQEVKKEHNNLVNLLESQKAAEAKSKAETNSKRRDPMKQKAVVFER